MEARTAGAFGLGFAAGALAVAGLLFWSGTLKNPSAEARSRVQQAVSAPTPAMPAGAPPSSPEASGEADRTAGTPSLMVPVQGVTKGSLQDSFEDSRQGGAHDAIDIPAPRGTPVLAAAEGNVVKLFKSERGGLTVYQFDNSRTWCYYYAHLEKYAAGLREGSLLRQGDVLGYVGTTGNAPADSPHLHFSIFRLGPEKEWWKGQAIDPLPLMRQGD